MKTLGLSLVKHYVQTVAYLGFYFGGGVQNFSGKVARGVRGHDPGKIFKNGAIWCVLESTLLKFCQKII